MLSRSGASGHPSAVKNGVLEAAIYLHQWDLPPPPLQSNTTSALYGAFQTLNTTENVATFKAVLDGCLLGVLDQSMNNLSIGQSLRTSMSTLGVLTEIDEAVASKSFVDLEEHSLRMHDRNGWMRREE